MKTISLLGLMVALTWLGSGRSGADGVQSIFEATLAEPNQKISVVSTEELRRVLIDGAATVFDARPPKEYALSYIPGALNVAGKPGVPMSQYVPDVGEITRALAGQQSAPIVLYCSGPFCGRSKRLSEELLEAGFTNVRRYQLGMPVWRALGGLTEIELDAIRYVHEVDRSAVFVDARDPEEFRSGTLAGARNLAASKVTPEKDAGEVRVAKDDGRLPMEDHNARIIVFGRDGAQAQAVAAAIIREAFHNVAFYGGTFESLSHLAGPR